MSRYALGEIGIEEKTYSLSEASCQYLTDDSSEVDPRWRVESNIYPSSPFCNRNISKSRVCDINYTSTKY
jgi:hypothetical protein